MVSICLSCSNSNLCESCWICATVILTGLLISWQKLHMIILFCLCVLFTDEMELKRTLQSLACGKARVVYKIPKVRYAYVSIGCGFCFLIKKFLSGELSCCSHTFIRILENVLTAPAPYNWIPLISNYLCG